MCCAMCCACSGLRAEPCRGPLAGVPCRRRRHTVVARAQAHRAAPASRAPQPRCEVLTATPPFSGPNRAERSAVKKRALQGSPPRCHGPHLVVARVCAPVDDGAEHGIGAILSPQDWLLQPVALGQLDDQDLFELSLRLKYVDDPRVVLPALLELHGSTLLDLPVEAVATRHDVLVGPGGGGDRVRVRADVCLCVCRAGRGAGARYLPGAREARPTTTSSSFAALTALVAHHLGHPTALQAHLLVLLTSASTRAELADLSAQCLTRLVVLLKKALLMGTDPSYGAAPSSGDAAGVEQPQQLDGANAQAAAEDGSARLLPQALPPQPGAAEGAASALAAEAARRLADAPLEPPVNVTKLAYLIALQVGLRGCGAGRDFWRAHMCRHPP